MSDGMDCNCGAYGEHECCCGADWTTQEVYDLREEVKQLREAADKVTQKTLAELCVQKEEELKDLKDAVMALEPFNECFGMDSKYGCDHWECQATEHDPQHIACPVAKLREVLTKLGGEQ
jgi:hypothetical protein